MKIRYPPPPKKNKNKVPLNCNYSVWESIGKWRKSDTQLCYFIKEDGETRSAIRYDDQLEVTNRAQKDNVMIIETYGLV
jgi:hypothetical protein